MHTPLKHAEAIAFAWRVHGAQESWTAKVDIKASIVLALDGVVLAAVITGHNKGGVFSQLVVSATLCGANRARPPALRPA